MCAVKLTVGVVDYHWDPWLTAFIRTALKKSKGKIKNSTKHTTKRKILKFLTDFLVFSKCSITIRYFLTAQQWASHTAPGAGDRKPGLRLKKSQITQKSVFEAPENLLTIPVERKDLRHMTWMFSLNKTTKRLTWIWGPGVSTPPRGMFKCLSVGM